jgi:hypothetical protein
LSRLAVFLRSNSPRPDALLPTDVEWIDIDVGALVGTLADRPVGYRVLARMALRLMGAAGARLRDQLDEFVARGGRMIVCGDDAALALAIVYRYLWKRPVVTTRFATEGVRHMSGWLGGWFRNRACHAIIAGSAQTGNVLRAHRDGRHGLLTLVQPLSDDPQVVQALVRDAVDIVGGAPAGDEHLRLAYVTHFYCNRQNADEVTDMFRRYAAYDSALLDRVHFVVVDDGSPVKYEVPDLDLNLTWIRIDQDIRWNQPGARNLGMTYARADNVFLCDVDIEVPEPTLAYFASRPPCGKWMYRPALRDVATGAARGRHPNVFLLSRARFMRFFGCDEDFSGHYAFDDLRFTKNQKLHGTLLARLPSEWFIYDRTATEGERAYHSLHRDDSHNALLNARKHFEIDWYGRNAGHSRRNLQFTWTILADRRRKRPAPALDRFYKPTWYLRQIWPT